MDPLPLLVACLLAVSTVFGGGAEAVQFQVTNNATGILDGTRFGEEVGVDYCKQTMERASSFIWALFQQDEVSRKQYEQVDLVLVGMKKLAYTKGNRIHLNAHYIAKYKGNNLARMVTGLLYHQLTHVWQWNGNGEARRGLTEGVADFVRLRAGYWTQNWKKPGEGERWDQGYNVTARFLDYCEGIRGGFVADINEKMREEYSDEFFVELLHKTADQLWSEYKAKYGG